MGLISDLVDELTWMNLNIKILGSSINRDFYAALTPKPEFDQLCAECPISFAPGLIDVLESDSPPKITFFQSLPAVDLDEYYWAVYGNTFSDGSSEFLFYIGSGTDAEYGVRARIPVYFNRVEDKPPVNIKTAFDDGAELEHCGLLCWARLPRPSLVPRARARFVAVEALFTTLFFASKQVTRSDEARMTILRPS
jgi:hypothetical protein